MSGDPHATLKLLLDEDLSPWVARRLREDDHLDAVHVRDRGRLGLADRQIIDFAFSEDRVLATANVGDFTRLAHARELHPGIVLVLDGNLLRPEQLELLRRAVALIRSEFAVGRDMVNRVLRIAAAGDHEFADLPTP